MGNRQNKTTSTDGNYSLVLGQASWVPAPSLSRWAVPGGRTPVPRVPAEVLGTSGEAAALQVPVPGQSRLINLRG